jgi:hypothetical protein
LNRLQLLPPIFGSFAVGNAGDIFAEDLIRHLWKAQTEVVETGPRLLCIGSIAHRIQKFDLVCGIGVKSELHPPPPAGDIELPIWGLRGPLSEKAFRARGYALPDLRFLLDPGLLIRNMFSETELAKVGHDIIFIPHYRDRAQVRKLHLRGMSVVDIDDTPGQIARRILQAKMVYSSSLHGLIFAHSLGRPVAFVEPLCAEPKFKYDDYFLSIGLNIPVPLKIQDRRAVIAASDTPISVSTSSFCFPDINLLRQRGILREAPY